MPWAGWVISVLSTLVVLTPAPWWRGCWPSGLGCCLPHREECVSIPPSLSEWGVAQGGWELSSTQQDPLTLIPLGLCPPSPCQDLIPSSPLIPSFDRRRNWGLWKKCCLSSPYGEFAQRLLQALKCNVLGRLWHVLLWVTLLESTLYFHSPFFKKKKKVVFKNSFIWLCWVLAAACKIFSCSIQTPGYGIQTLICCMWGLFPWPGIEPRTPELGGWSLSHWTTRGVPHPATFHHHNSLLRKQSSSFLKPKSISVRSHTTLWVSFKNWG